MRVPAHIKYIVISVLFILASINFTRTTFEILNSSKRLDEVRNEVAFMDEEKRSLEESIDYKKTDEYLEERARNDLNLVKPGEKLYVVENVDLEGDSEEDVLAEFSERIRDNVRSKESNAFLWYKLFFD